MTEPKICVNARPLGSSQTPARLLRERPPLGSCVNARLPVSCADHEEKDDASQRRPFLSYSSEISLTPVEKRGFRSCRTHRYNV